MFYDWLHPYQDFDFKLPIISDERFFVQDTVTGEIKTDRQCPVVEKGSFSTSITFKVTANRVEVVGNPSRFNRLDNFEGFRTLDDCFAVYNQTMDKLGLPRFSKCTRVWRGRADSKGIFPIISDGACLKEVHVTSNQANGAGMAQTVIRALSTQRFNNSLPYLFSDSNSVTWKSAQGNQRLLRPTVYNKAVEMDLKLLPKMKRSFGQSSDEFNYVTDLSRYCHDNGITRHEVNLKPEWLSRNGCKFWGLFDENKLKRPHEELMKVQDRLEVSHMTVENVSDMLIRKGICTSKQSSNSTALYYMEWMHGKSFDLQKKQVQTHRARLRLIGVDIAQPCDLSRVSSIQVIKSQEVISMPAVAPDWYRHPVRPVQLKLVA